MQHIRRTPKAGVLAGAATLALVAALTASCRGPARATSLQSTGSDSRAGRPGTVTQAPHFDRLFTAGARWRFAVERRTDGEADDGEAGAATCEVTAVRHFAGGRASELECSGDHDEDPFGGVWIQTADGLWSGRGLPDDGVTPELASASRVLPPRLVADANGELVADPPSPPREDDVSETVRVDGDAWCMDTAFGGGETSWTTICIDELGPLSGRIGWGGDVTHEVELYRDDD